MFTQFYVRYNLTNGTHIEDLERDTLRSVKMLEIAVRSARKMDYTSLDTTNLFFNGKKVVSIMGTFFKDNILFEIIVSN